LLRGQAGQAVLGLTRDGRRAEQRASRERHDAQSVAGRRGLACRGRTGLRKLVLSDELAPLVLHGGERRRRPAEVTQERGKRDVAALELVAGRAALRFLHQRGQWILLRARGRALALGRHDERDDERAAGQRRQKHGTEPHTTPRTVVFLDLLEVPDVA
jgi:hypothetical protein